MHVHKVLSKGRQSTLVNLYMPGLISAPQLEIAPGFETNVVWAGLGCMLRAKMANKKTEKQLENQGLVSSLNMWYYYVIPYLSQRMFQVSTPWFWAAFLTAGGFVCSSIVKVQTIWHPYFRRNIELSRRTVSIILHPSWNCVLTGGLCLSNSFLLPMQKC